MTYMHRYAHNYNKTKVFLKIHMVGVVKQELHQQTTHLDSVDLALQLALEVEELPVRQLPLAVLAEEVGQEGGAQPIVHIARRGSVPVPHPHARLVANHFLHLFARRGHYFLHGLDSFIQKNLDIVLFRKNPIEDILTRDIFFFFFFFSVFVHRRGSVCDHF